MSDEKDERLAEAEAEASALRDHLDLMVDEFRRIKSELRDLADGIRVENAPSIVSVVYQLCDRAVEASRQRVPLIVQRDRLASSVNERVQRIAELERERDELREHELAVALCVGIAYEADGHDPAPGPRDEVLRELKMQRDQAVIADEWEEKCAELERELDALHDMQDVYDAAIAMVDCDDGGGTVGDVLGCWEELKTAVKDARTLSKLKQGGEDE